MNEILKCSRCGAEIPSGSTGGVCPRCAAGFLRATQTEMSEDAASKRDFNPPSVAELRPLFPQLEIAIEKGSAPSQSKAASGADTPPSNAIDAKNSKDGPAWLKAFLAGALVLFVVVCSLSVVLVTTLRGFVLTLATAGALGLAILLFVRKLSWGRGFVAAFLLVFLVVFGFGAFVTAVLPDSFVSTARIKITPSPTNNPGPDRAPGTSASYDPYLLQTEIELIRSEVILDKVITDLDLDRAYARKWNGGRPLTRAETLELVKRQLDVRPVRNTSLVEIRIFDKDPNNAAGVANKIAEVYQRAHQEGLFKSGINAIQVEIIDSATPGFRPVRPNRPLNLTLAALTGILLGGVAGAARVGLKARPRPNR